MAIFDEISGFLRTQRRSHAKTDQPPQSSGELPSGGEWIRAVRHRNGREFTDSRWHLQDGTAVRTRIGWEVGTTCGRWLTISRWSPADDRVVEHGPAVDEAVCETCRAATRVAANGNHGS
jgi:hypothetical protein